MSKERKILEEEIRCTRRAFIALIGTYALIIIAGSVKSCNDKFRGFETICFSGANRAGVECIERPILKGGEENERK